jgi:translation initiation factor 2 alpha subunit (eIF-2alpha)
MPASQQDVKLPEDGEIVVATVREVSRHGAYVNLEEYGSTTIFLHISEIATGWIRNVERYIRPRQKTVLKVIRIKKARGAPEKQNGTFDFTREESIKSYPGLRI